MLKSFILHQRPFAIFDPANKEHRDIFYKFQKTQSWKHCPYQWTIEDDSTNLVYFLNRKLLDYYMSLEFKAKKPRAKPVLKIKDIKTRKKAAN
jgi:hypothetical protein